MIKFIDLPSPNYFEASNPVKAVCLHGTSSPLQSAISWLRNPQPNNPDGRVSANFVVSKAGIIYRLVDFERGERAFANGFVEDYDKSIDWLVDAVAHKINPNLITVSIEHEASYSDMLQHKSMPVRQFDSSIDLTAYILHKCNLKANHQTIIGHNQISGKQKYNCPGVIFPPAYTEIVIDRYPDLAS